MEIVNSEYEVRCPKCDRLLLKVTGIAGVETRCRHCKITVKWPTLVSTTGNESPGPLAPTKLGM